MTLLLVGLLQVHQGRRPVAHLLGLCEGNRLLLVRRRDGLRVVAVNRRLHQRRHPQAALLEIGHGKVVHRRLREVDGAGEACPWGDELEDERGIVALVEAAAVPPASHGQREAGAAHAGNGGVQARQLVVVGRQDAVEGNVDEAMYWC